MEETFPTEEIDSILLSIKSINIPYETNYLKSRNSIFFYGKCAKIFETKYLKSEIIFISIPATMFVKNLDKYLHTKISDDILCNKRIAYPL